MAATANSIPPRPAAWTIVLGAAFPVDSEGLPVTSGPLGMVLVGFVELFPPALAASALYSLMVLLLPRTLI